VRNAGKILVVNPQGTPLARPRRKWKCDVEIELGQSGCGSLEWIHQAEDVVQWLAAATLH
jgi:hypothetical protein